jgi:general secretion pathway protein D
MIMLQLKISLVAFTPDSTQTEVAQTTREIETITLVADREVLALGGLIRNRIEDSMSKWPVLGDIPVLGWLFKNKRDNQIKDNLLVLISTRIIEPRSQQQARSFTHERIESYQGYLADMSDVSERHDPIHHMFFEERKNATARVADEFLFKRHHDAMPMPKTPKIKGLEKPLDSTPPAPIQALANDSILQTRLQRRPKNSLTSLVTSGEPVT